VPATALFPVLLLYLVHWGGGLQIGAIVLMLLGTMWYILFNVIAGAQAIPSELFEAAKVYRLSRVQRWKTLILPGIFPYLITGMITAVGAAWNASIVSEYVQFQGKTLTTLGLGATISQASATRNYALLLAATGVMSLIVVLTNRLVWRRLYRLAQSKYQLN
ncbi:MAG TPA: ABC transporter permease subunit, partial [Allocoleopsis sp.]